MYVYVYIYTYSSPRHVGSFFCGTFQQKPYANQPCLLRAKNRVKPLTGLLPVSNSLIIPIA